MKKYYRMTKKAPNVLTLSQSERLTLNLITKLDLEEVRELHNNPLVLSQLTDIREVSDIDQVNWYKSISYSKTSFRIVARLKPSNQLIGVFRIDKFDTINLTAQVGLDVHPNYHRRGFAREIYCNVLTVLFSDWNLHRVYLETLSSNVAARSLYDALGFKVEGFGREAILRIGNRVDLVYYGLLGSEWKLANERLD
jgi:ribosomal-protein-alanine N-acetyltransferase